MINQALNRAMMQLYRDHKVNPMGGCLPMVIQIPVFFAFYNALLYSIELRHAPFICWETKLLWIGRGICDLSVYDPSYVTPVLDGHDHVPPAEDDANGRRPGPGEDHAVYAADVSLLLSQCPGRFGASTG